MYIQHIPYRGIGSKRTYKLRILCKYIIITFCCQLFFPTKISGDTCAPPDTILSFILLSVNTIFYLEIHLCVIVAALQELLHLLLAWLSWVGACTCIKYRICSDLRKSLKEYILRNKALLTWIAVRSIILDTVRYVQLVIHLAQIRNKKVYLLVECLSAKAHEICYLAVTNLCCLILCIESDNLREIHRFAAPWMICAP